ncbi:MAG: hypothetical protein MZV63_37055 [Marinilabiliales bacterium]|nr:hypothetical protein [Marinilabiliales bacterium]
MSESFPAIVAFNEHSAMPHYTPGESQTLHNQGRWHPARRFGRPIPGRHHRHHQNSFNRKSHT